MARVSDGSGSAVKTGTGLIEDDSTTAQAGTPLFSPLHETVSPHDLEPLSAADQKLIDDGWKMLKSADQRASDEIAELRAWKATAEEHIAALINQRRELSEQNTTLLTQLSSLERERDEARKAQDIVRRLVSAHDVWTDHGSGFRIHFSFAPGSDDRIIVDVMSARSALSSDKGASHDA